MAGTATIACTNCGKRNRVPPGGRGVPRCGFCHTALPWIVDADAASFDSAIGIDLLFAGSGLIMSALAGRQLARARSMSYLRAWFIRTSRRTGTGG